MIPASAEFALSTLAILVWVGVMFRYVPDLVENRREKAYSALVVILIVWTTLVALLVRAIHDMGLLSQNVALVSGGVVRGVFLIAGIVLILIGPTTGRR